MLSRTTLARVMSASARTASRLSSASPSWAAMSPGCWCSPLASTESWALQISSRRRPSTSWAWSKPSFTDHGHGLIPVRFICLLLWQLGYRAAVELAVSLCLVLDPLLIVREQTSFMRDKVKRILVHENHEVREGIGMGDRRVDLLQH